MQEIEIVRIPVAPYQYDDAIAAIKDAKAGYLAPPNCQRFEAAAGDNEIVVIITWASSDAHIAAQSSPEAGAFFGLVEKYAAGEPSISTFHRSASEGRLSGQVAVVTGGASGIGRAVVDAYVREGARVAAVDINADALSDVAGTHGEAVVAIEADLRTVEGNEAVVSKTIEAFGRLDTYVANAGMFDGFTEFSDLSLQQIDAGFDALFSINVKAVMLGCRAALPYLVKSRGSIILTLSNSALYADGGGLLYVASKHAGLGMVRQLAHELAPVIRVNGVAPGATKASIGVPKIIGETMDQTSPEVSEAISQMIPLKRHSDPSDHSNAFVMLASRAESPAMTGTVIESEGGLGVRGLRRTRGGDGLEEKFS